jgi:hypothetical protein
MCAPASLRSLSLATRIKYAFYLCLIHHDCAMPRSQHLAPDTALPLARTSRPPPVFRGAAPPATAPLALRTHCALRGVHFFRDCTSTIDGTSEVHLRDGTSMHHPPRVTARRGVLFVLRGARSARGWTRISAGYVCRENVFRFSREREREIDYRHSSLGMGAAPRRRLSTRYRRDTRPVPSVYDRGKA